MGFTFISGRMRNSGSPSVPKIGDAIYQVKNLREGTVADTIFELPAGYARYEGQWKP